MRAPHPPEALRRIVAAELRVAVQGRALPGVGLGLLSLAALLERRAPWDPGDVDRLREAIGRMLDVLVPGRPAAAVASTAVTPLRFARPEPARAAR